MAAVERRKGGYPRGKPRTKPSTGKGRSGSVTLTTKLGTAICKHVSTGTPKRFAALAEGVSENTVLEWVRRGEGNDERPATPLMTWFAGEMRKAEALDVNRRKVRLDKIAEDGDPRVDMWWLERRHPEEFARAAERLEITGAGGGDIVIRLAFDQTPIAARTRAELGGPVIDVDGEELA